jgi:hypothetical protein
LALNASAPPTTANTVIAVNMIFAFFIKLCFLAKAKLWV